MREIKFRAWDKKERQMIKPMYVINQHIPTEPTQDGFKLKSEFILMQYTGLKDKNGKEIYEGDIIEYEEFDSDGKRYPNKERREVIYVDCCFNLCELDVDELWKVIGNIYENPELLK